MFPPDASVSLTKQIKHSPLVSQSHVQGCEWGLSETRVAPTFILLGPPMQEQEWLQFPGRPDLHSYRSSPYISNSRWSDPHFPDTSLYSTPANQVNLNLVGAEDDLFAFFEFDPSSISNTPDSAFTSLNPTEDGIQWSSPEYGLSLMFVENPEAVDSVIQASDGDPGYSTLSTFVPPPTSLATNLDLNISSSSQDLEARFQTTDPCASPSVDISAPHWGSGRPVVLFLAENSSIPNLSDPAAEIYRSPCPAENSRKVDYKAVQSSSHTERQAILFEGVVGLCEWQNGDGTVCFEELSLASLPGHLSTHGIKKKSRDWPTKCSWVGCRRKRSMNRESIVRHIREVHLRQKRSTKRTQDPCFRGAGLPPG